MIQIQKSGTHYKVRKSGHSGFLFIERIDLPFAAAFLSNLPTGHPRRTIQSDVWNGGRPKLRVTTIVSPKFYTQ
jgi:hypothetical protein